MKSSTRRLFIRSLIAASLAPVLANVAPAADRCCLQCGCSASRCRKVCRLVREDKKITTTCWGMECEDLCVPGPSRPECKHCEMVCGKGEGDKDICVQPKKLVWTTWLPGCGRDIVTKRKLMKKTVTKSVPSFKWVVEDLCKECMAQTDPVSVPANAEVPPAPKIEGAIVLASVAEE